VLFVHQLGELGFGLMTITARGLGLDVFDIFKAEEWKSIRPVGREDLSGQEFEAESEECSYYSIP
jgi:hypothetical protein